MRLQLSPAQEGLRVGNLKNPRTSAALGTIEKARLPIDVKKYLLDQIIRFAFVSQDSAADIANGPCKTFK